MDQDLEKLINDIVWWIPIKKLRNNIRDLFNILFTKNNTNIEYINRLRYNLKKVTPQAYLNVIEIHLAEHCNFSCYSCTHFSPLATEEYYDINIFESDIKRLFYLSNGLVNRFHLMGGEPLLNKNCKDYVYILRKYFKKSNIWIVTNGILLEKQDENFWNACKDNNIEIRPTKYPININWDNIQNICNQYDVKLEFFNNANVLKESIKSTFNLYGTSDPFENFINCSLANNCLFLSNGKLFTCGIASNIRHFNNFFDKNLEITEFDYINIHKAKDYNEILQFLAKPIPFCRYCNISQWHSIGKWMPSKRDIKEYI